MPREIIHYAQGPYYVDEDEFEEQGNRIAICRCGLSDDKPFCDASHEATKDEEEHLIYRYVGEDDTERVVVRDRT